MNPGGNLSKEEIGIVVVSLLNICLLILAAFYRRRDPDAGDSALRLKMGYVAVSLGLCSQLLYGAMLLVWKYEWIPLDPGVKSLTHLEARLSNVGCLVSVLTALVALFARGQRRYAGIWVGTTTSYFWGAVGLGAALKSLFR